MIVSRGAVISLNKIRLVSERRLPSHSEIKKGLVLKKHVSKNAIRFRGYFGKDSK